MPQCFTRQKLKSSNYLKFYLNLIGLHNQVGNTKKLLIYMNDFSKFLIMFNFAMEPLKT